MFISSELGLDLHESVLGEDWTLIELLMEARQGNLSVIQPKMLRALTATRPFPPMRYRKVGFVAGIGAGSQVVPVTDFKLSDVEALPKKYPVVVVSYGGHQILAVAKTREGSYKDPGLDFISIYGWEDVLEGLKESDEGKELFDTLRDVRNSNRAPISMLKALVKHLIKASDLEDRQLTLLGITADPDIAAKGKERAAARKGMIPRTKSPITPEYFDKTAGQYKDRDTINGIRRELLSRLDKFKKSRVGASLKDPNELVSAMLKGGFFLNVKVGDHIYELAGTDGSVQNAMRLSDAPGTVADPLTKPRDPRGSGSFTTGFCLRYQLPVDERRALIRPLYRIEDDEERERYKSSLPPFEFKVYFGTQGGTIVPTEVVVTDERGIF
jgi:hypothetical protein